MAALSLELPMGTSAHHANPPLGFQSGSNSPQGQTAGLRDRQLAQGHTPGRTPVLLVSRSQLPHGVGAGSGHNGTGGVSGKGAGMGPGWLLVGETGSAQGTLIPISVLPLRSFRLCSGDLSVSSGAAREEAQGHDSM